MTTENDRKQELLMLEKQNAAFLKFAETGKDMPSYRWLVGVLNVPAKPPTPEQLHMADIAEKISEAETRLRALKGSKPDALQRQYDLAKQAVKIAAGYRQDISRIPAFYELAAFCNLIRAGMDINPNLNQNTTTEEAI